MFCTCSAKEIFMEQINNILVGDRVIKLTNNDKGMHIVAFHRNTKHSLNVSKCVKYSILWLS